MLNDNAFPNAGSITGSGGAQITGSGIFLYLDYASPYDNGEFLTFEGTDVSGVPPPIISPFKPYAFYFKRK